MAGDGQRLKPAAANPLGQTLKRRDSADMNSAAHTELSVLQLYSTRSTHFDPFFAASSAAFSEARAPARMLAMA
jgi:hypothetical protein